MERNVAYPAGMVSGVQVRTGWAQIEMFSGEGSEVQALIAGDEGSVKSLIIRHENGKLLVEQPQYGLSLDLVNGRWMQICVCVPSSWQGEISVATVSGAVSLKNMRGGDISCDTVSSPLHADRIQGEVMTLNSVTGTVQATRVGGQTLRLRNVSGNTNVFDASFDAVRLTTVSGAVQLGFVKPFATLEAQSATGDVQIALPAASVQATLRAITGELKLQGVDNGGGEGTPTIQATAVTGDIIITNRHAE